jgi:hypothetical protein
MAVTCAAVERLMAANTTRPGAVLSVLAYTATFEISLEVAWTEVSPKFAFAPSKPRNTRKPARA